MATDEANIGREYLERNINFYAGIMGIIAFVSGVAGMTQKTSFGYLGENTTF